MNRQQASDILDAAYLKGDGDWIAMKDYLVDSIKESFELGYQTGLNKGWAIEQDADRWSFIDRSQSQDCRSKLVDVAEMQDGKYREVDDEIEAEAEFFSDFELDEFADIHDIVEDIEDEWDDFNPDDYVKDYVDKFDTDVDFWIDGDIWKKEVENENL